ncbi:MAG: twin-arginine translocation signal domain-containing protein, partial [Planctomycetota bacterium]
MSHPISRRELMKGLAISGISLGTGTLLTSCNLTGRRSIKNANSQKPNILFIFADDWGWGDLSCHGHPYV